MVLSILQLRWLGIWWFVFLLPSLPVLFLFLDAWAFHLGADPAKVIVDTLGQWALYLLWITLSISTLARRKIWAYPMRFRRMIGLWAFCYALLHFLAFATFIVGWRADLLWEALSERPYIYVGATAFLLLLLLAVTSPVRVRKVLKKNWARIHRLIYPAALLVIVHLFWLVRSSYAEVVLYSVLLLLLLLERCQWYWVKKVKNTKKVLATRP